MRIAFVSESWNNDGRYPISIFTYVKMYAALKSAGFNVELIDSIERLREEEWDIFLVPRSFNDASCGVNSSFYQNVYLKLFDERLVNPSSPLCRPYLIWFSCQILPMIGGKYVKQAFTTSDLIWTPGINIRSSISVGKPHLACSMGTWDDEPVIPLAERDPIPTFIMNNKTPTANAPESRLKMLLNANLPYPRVNLQGGGWTKYLPILAKNISLSKCRYSSDAVPRLMYSMEFAHAAHPREDRRLGDAFPRWSDRFTIALSSLTHLCTNDDYLLNLFPSVRRIGDPLVYDEEALIKDRSRLLFTRWLPNLMELSMKYAKDHLDAKS